MATLHLAKGSQPMQPLVLFSPTLTRVLSSKHGQMDVVILQTSMNTHYIFFPKASTW